MSQEAVAQIISKAVLEPEFRKELFAKQEKILAGYDLTDEEKKDFSQLTPEAFDSFATDVEQRVSKSGLLLNPDTLRSIKLFQRGA
jgi:hypothetical protein